MQTGVYLDSGREIGGPIHRHTERQRAKQTNRLTNLLVDALTDWQNRQPTKQIDVRTSG